jgi:hypothetical protein
MRTTGMVVSRGRSRDAVRPNPAGAPLTIRPRREADDRRAWLDASGHDHTGILSRMPDEPKGPPVGSMRRGQSVHIVGEGGVTLPSLRVSGTLTVVDIRAAIQELRDSSVDELRRLVIEYYRDNKAGHTTDSDILAAKVETTTRMVKVARLLRAGAKWGAVTIIASLIGVAVDHEVSDLMGWTPPSITIVRQMSRPQMDELSHQILQQLEQMRKQQEHR